MVLGSAYDSTEGAEIFKNLCALCAKPKYAW